MKLLLDANISWRMLNQISEHFPESAHVDSIPVNRPAKDIQIWNYALKHDYTIVTNDEDFSKLSLYKGFPPKVIILRLGNMSTFHLSKVLKDHKQEILHFAASDDVGILEIY